MLDYHFIMRGNAIGMLFKVLVISWSYVKGGPRSKLQFEDVTEIMISLLTAQSWRIKSGVEEYQNIGQDNTKDQPFEKTSKCGGTIPAAKIIKI